MGPEWLMSITLTIIRHSDKTSYVCTNHNNDDWFDILSLQ